MLSENKTFSALSFRNEKYLGAITVNKNKCFVLR